MECGVAPEIIIGDHRGRSRSPAIAPPIPGNTWGIPWKFMVGTPRYIFYRTPCFVINPLNSVYLVKVDSMTSAWIFSPTLEY